MAIRKKSFTSTLQPTEAIPGAVPLNSAKGTATSVARPVLHTESIALSKRTVSRILLAKSLLGR